MQLSQTMQPHHRGRPVLVLSRALSAPHQHVALFMRPPASRTGKVFKWVGVANRRPLSRLAIKGFKPERKCNVSKYGPKKSVNGISAVAPTSPAKPKQYIEAKPSHEDVCKRAYEIYLKRTAAGHMGDASADWSRAERELAAK